MFFKQISSYLILDTCLEVFFKQIEKNFRKVNINQLPKIGDFYSKIMSKDGYETFIDCKILDIYTHENIICVKIEYDDYDINELDDGDDGYDESLADDILDEEGIDWEAELYIDTIIYQEYNFII